MKNCPACGAWMQDSDKFCNSCGMKFAPPAAPGYEPPERPQEPEGFRPEAEAQEAAPQAAPNEAQAAPQQAPATADGWYRPLSAWAYALTLFLMGLPLVGLVLQIIWAAGGTNSLNRQNLARGYLLMRCCLALLVLLILVVALAALLPLLSRYADGIMEFFYRFLY